MAPKQKRTLGIIMLLGVLYFVAFYFPNSTGSVDINMVAVFEPDENVQLSQALQMVSPQKSLEQSLRRFFAYQHYYYGFPFFGSSALLLFLLRFVGQVENTPLVMVVLRQLISVLPMVAAVGVLVYLQTRFTSTWKAVVLFLFLLSVPAVARNSRWWHPESQTILFLVLTLFFLDRDKLRFGRNFYLAAAACGLAIGTKMLGVFYFLTIPTYIVWGYFIKGINIKRAISAGIIFISLAGLTVLVSNPLLITISGRARYLEILQQQAESTRLGFGVLYGTGPKSWAPVLTEYYGQLVFFLVPIVGLIVGVVSGRKRLLSAMILSWALPYTLYLLYLVAVKSFHYFLPVALPLFSGAAVWLDVLFPDDRPQGKRQAGTALRWAAILGVIVAAFQFGSNIQWSINDFVETLHREENEPLISFYEQVEEVYIAQLPDQERLLIYKDVRLYVPPSPRWKLIFQFELLDYKYFNKQNPDVILLMRQRILDYTHPAAVENPINPAQMERSFTFYSDAKAGELEGYHLVYQDDTGLAFVRDDLYEIYLLGQ